MLNVYLKFHVHYFILGKGINHECCRTQAVINLIAHAESLSPASAEKVASGDFKYKKVANS